MHMYSCTPEQYTLVFIYSRVFGQIEHLPPKHVRTLFVFVDCRMNVYVDNIFFLQITISHFHSPNPFSNSIELPFFKLGSR